MGFNRRILSTFFVSYVESLFSCESIPLSNTYVKDRQEGFLETEISDDRNREAFILKLYALFTSWLSRVCHY